MGRTRILSGADDNLLMDFLRGCQQATVYHTPHWRNAVVATYGYEPIYLAHDNGGTLDAVLPMMFVKSWLTGRRLVSLPFSNVCGPVGSPEGVASIVERAIGICRERGARALELRTQAGMNTVADRRFTPSRYFITSLMYLDTDPTRVWKGFKDKNLRTEIRQATKKGITVSRCQTMEDLAAFYSLFAGTRLKHGVPPQPYRFFQNLRQHMDPQQMDLFMATYRERPVGGFITLGFGATLYAAYIGSNPDYRPYRVHQILIWKAIEMGCLRGYSIFDFLRTPKSSPSLRYFKERWNAREVDLEYAYYPEVRGTASAVEDTAKYAVLTAVLRRSPVAVGRLLGRVLYKHLG